MNQQQAERLLNLGIMAGLVVWLWSIWKLRGPFSELLTWVAGLWPGPPRLMPYFVFLTLFLAGRLITGPRQLVYGWRRRGGESRVWSAILGNLLAYAVDVSVVVALMIAVPSFRPGWAPRDAAWILPEFSWQTVVFLAVLYLTEVLLLISAAWCCPRILASMRNPGQPPVRLTRQFEDYLSGAVFLPVVLDIGLFAVLGFLSSAASAWRHLLPTMLLCLVMARVLASWPVGLLSCWLDGRNGDQTAP